GMYFEARFYFLELFVHFGEATLSSFTIAILVNNLVSYGINCLAIHAVPVFVLHASSL
ncbi:hypothetical protein ACJX0J_018905, partial [Zea mays]